MGKKYTRSVSLVICLVLTVGCFGLVYAAEKPSTPDAGKSTFKERLQERADRFEDTWVNAPRRRHTDSSPFDTSPKQTPERQRAFKERMRRFEDTWVNAPRRHHPLTTAQRQAAFKQRCQVFEDTWVNAPRRRHTDSSPFETAAVVFEGGVAQSGK